MTNADKFKNIFGLYATELWSMPEKDFLEWLNSEAVNCSEIPNNSDTISRQMLLEYIHGEPVGRLLCDKYNLDGLIEQLPSVQPEFPNNSKELEKNSTKLDKENGECNDCIKHGGDWECDRVHCHKGDVPDTNVGELISRQKAKDAIDMALDHKDHVPSWVYDNLLNALNEVPSAQPERKKGKWIGKEKYMNSPEYFSWQCSVCGCVLEDPTLDKPYPFCPNCGCQMNGGNSE